MSADDLALGYRQSGNPVAHPGRQAQAVNHQLVPQTLGSHVLAGQLQLVAGGIERDAFEFTLLAQVGVVPAETDLRAFGPFLELVQLPIAGQQVDIAVGDRDAFEVFVDIVADVELFEDDAAPVVEDPDAA
jgi:hypothetical protein